MILFLNQNQGVKMNTSQSQEDGFSSNDYLGQLIMIVAIIRFLALAIPCILTLSYLNNVPTATKCFLLYLYQDSIASFLMIRSIWLIKVFLAYWHVEGTSKATALSVSFVLWLAAFYMAIIMVFISIYELYMAKTKIINPKVPFLDEDELLGLGRKCQNLNHSADSRNVRKYTQPPFDNLGQLFLLTRVFVIKLQFKYLAIQYLYENLV